MGMAGRPAGYGVEQLLASPRFRVAISHLAENFVAQYLSAPRIAAPFATQQRWLLCQAVLARHFRPSADGKGGLTRAGFAHAALQSGIASRNTAYAFFDEALKYGILRSQDESGALVPSPGALSLLCLWYDAHLCALDLIDGAQRSTCFQADPQTCLPRLAPSVADGLLANRAVRAPGPLYTIFTWADSGGLLMDRLIAGIDWQILPAHGGHITDVTSISDLARSFGLSRAHASRKLAAAESIGALGWSGRRGHSRIWISADFYAEYATAQAQKLSIIDTAFSALRADDPSSGRGFRPV